MTFLKIHSTHVISFLILKGTYHNLILNSMYPAITINKCTN